jgi:hypothetical protein
VPGSTLGSDGAGECSPCAHAMHATHSTKHPNIDPSTGSVCYCRSRREKKNRRLSTNKRIFTFADNYQVSPSTITFYTYANAYRLDRKFPVRKIIKRTLTSTTSFDPTASHYQLHLVRKRCLERPVNKWAKECVNEYGKLPSLCHQCLLFSFSWTL